MTASREQRTSTNEQIIGKLQGVINPAHVIKGTILNVSLLHEQITEIISALRLADAAERQEPVAWRIVYPHGTVYYDDTDPRDVHPQAFLDKCQSITELVPKLPAAADESGRLRK